MAYWGHHWYLYSDKYEITGLFYDVQKEGRGDEYFNVYCVSTWETFVGPVKYN